MIIVAVLLSKASSRLGIPALLFFFGIRDAKWLGRYRWNLFRRSLGSSIFNIIFFVVLTSSLVQGSSLNLISKWLKVQRPLSPRQARTLPQDIELTSDGALTIFEVHKGDIACG